ncbi:MAG: amidohydrolase [Aestuariibacter sp.]
MKWIFAILFSTSLTVSATTVIYNVKGHTVADDKLVQFSAVAFDNGKVINTYKTKPELQPGINYIDGKGQSLLPGLIDSHGHVVSYGKALSSVDLVGTASVDEALSRVAEFARQNPNASVISGRGWNQELWPNRTFPSATLLDALNINKPIVLGRVDGHALWVNSAALKLATISAETKSPDGGEILLNDSGKPSGILIDNAMNLVYQVLPKDNIDSVKAIIIKSLNRLASLGLTSVHDAGIDKMTYDAYRELAKAHALPIRVYAMLDVTDPQYKTMLANGHIQSDDGMLSIRSVKISSDGALGSRGAALHEDYSDQPGNRGLLLHSVENLNALTRQAMTAGFQVNTHAIGDRANTLTLDSFANWIEKTSSQSQRHRIEHAQVVRPGEFNRFVDLDVIASVQPTHATSDKNMAEDRLGSERMKGAYAWQTLYQIGATVAGGSDFPIEPAEPFFGIHAAVTRQDRNNQPEGGWYAQESATLEQAIRMFSIDAAYAAHQDNMIGSIEPGKYADFILVDLDPFETAPEKLWQTQVQETWIAGQRVFP